MEYGGIKYSLRLGIIPGQWLVVIHAPNSNPIEKRVRGSRQSAELAARSMIETWLKLHPPQGPKNSN
jgi:hypothetical protein